MDALFFDNNITLQSSVFLTLLKILIYNIFKSFWFKTDFSNILYKFLKGVISDNSAGNFYLFFTQ